MVEVPVRQADGDRLLDGRGHGAPRAPEQPRDLLPGQRAGPRRQRHQQCVRHLLLPTHPGHRLDMHAGASRAPHAARRVAQRHRDPPQRYMAEAPYWTGVSVRAPRPTLAASGHEAAVWGQLGHQSARVSRHRHDPKPLQFHRRLDQTFQEHESPLRYPGCVTTPKYLMRLMFFNSQPSSACIHLYDEPILVPLRDRCSFGRFPWLISQALSVTYMAGERRLYLERNCRLPESPAHSRRRNREGPASSKGLNSQRGFGPAVEPRRKLRPRSTSLHGSSPCKC